MRSLPKMRWIRALVLAVLFVVAVAVAWWYTHRQISLGRRHDHRVLRESRRDDAGSLARFRSVRRAIRASVAFYAATQCVAGPPPGTEAVRFPAGTRVRAVDVVGTTADVDLTKDVASSAEGGFAESAEFKALVWTLTQPSLDLSAVTVRVDGARVATLPGGHLELDEPLSRSSF